VAHAQIMGDDVNIPRHDVEFAEVTYDTMSIQNFVNVRPDIL
jgi:hypothetical protein